MPRNITVTFEDGTTHVYQNAPDDVTPDAVQARAAKEFGKRVTAMDGGRSAPPVTPPGQIPGVGPYQAPPTEIPLGRRMMEGARRSIGSVVQLARPTVEALGGAGGAVLGTAAAPGLGTVAGAGLGYGLAKGGLDVLEQALGYQAPPSSVEEAIVRGGKDVLIGGSMEAGGRVLGQAVPAVIGKVADLRQIPKQKAATIAKQALGGDLDNVVNALRNAPPNASVAELTAGIENPTWQALIQRSLERDPQFVRKLNLLGERESRNTLAQLAGGATATEVRAGVEATKQRLRDITTPQRETALARANLGKAVAETESEAQQLTAQAAGKVEDVRFLKRAETLAEKAGVPKGPIDVADIRKYTYPLDLAKKADEWASQAATASLDLGQGARFAQGAANALRSVGIKPLEGQPLINSIATVSRNPEFAGNDLVQGALKNVADDIAKWTSSGGIIDARALDAIRKNSVNAAVAQLRPGFDATAQRNAAAGVLTEIKPAIVNAIEAAGGTGYREYLANFTKGMQQIAEKELRGEALRLWKTDKDAFVRLVQNESPEAVEKILGPGKYNIATELADSAMDVLREQARKRITQVSVKEQAGEGQVALRELMRQNVSKLRVPSHLQAWVTNTNRGLQILEEAIGQKTLNTLTQALKTPQGATDLLSTLPGQERLRVMQLMQTSPMRTAKEAAKVAPAATLQMTNALAPESESTNALSP